MSRGLMMGRKNPKRSRCKVCQRTHNVHCWRQKSFRKKLRRAGHSKAEINQRVREHFHPKVAIVDGEKFHPPRVECSKTQSSLARVFS